MAAAAPAPGDAAAYAEKLRRDLIEGLGLEDLGDAGASEDGGSGAGDTSLFGGGLSGGSGGGGPDGGGGLRGLGAELDALAGSDVVRDILDRGAPPRDLARGVDERLRAAELASIQDYISESDSLVKLHGQVGARAAGHGVRMACLPALQRCPPAPAGGGARMLPRTAHVLAPRTP